MKKTILTLTIILSLFVFVKIVKAETCASFTYSDWSSCNNDQQTRTVLSSSPDGCTEGSPILTQSCTSTAPTCTSWTYSDWDTCSANGQQTRTIVSSSPEGCSGGSPVLTQTCTPTPTCTVDTWTCSEWSTCSSNSTQTRTCVITNDCPGVDTPSPSTTQSCIYNGPTITSISPTTIYPNTTVIINGTKFMNLGAYAYSCPTCKILINDKEVIGVSMYSWYENKVTFSVPSDAQSGYIQVQDSKGNKSNKFNFTISIDPATVPPIITSITPKAITPGDVITITGSNFGSSRGSNQLIIGGTSPWGTILSWTDTEIKYQSSNYYDAKSKKIGIKKCKSYFDCLDVVYSGYFYIQPKITSILPTAGPTGMKITIYGNYFKDENVASDSSTEYSIKVYFNGIEAKYPKNGIWTSTMVEVTVPEGATSGNISLEIIADTGEKVTTTGPYFTVWEKISNDTYSSSQLYLKQINLPQAWGVTSNRRSIVVAVIDDGIHNSHPDLQSNLWVNEKEKPGNKIDDDKNGYVDDRFGWDFVYNTNDITPNGSHGTVVAGIIGAITDNSIGIAGINKNVKLMPVIACDKYGSCPTAAVIKAIKYAVDNGAEVINLSLGSTDVVGYTAEYDEIINYAYDHNVIIVAAAGNGNIPYGDGWDLNIHPQSPVCNDNNLNMIIGVGVVDGKNFRTKWSNYGSKYVDIYAPGVDILSTSVPTLIDRYDQLTSIDGGGYYSKASGTSFSAPIITGIVSLLKATFPTITSQEAINLLINNSNNGVVDAYKTLSANFTPTNKESIGNTFKETIDCSDGYVRDDKGICITIDQLCKNFYGSYSYYTKTLNDKGSYVCDCLTDYEFNSERTQCIVKKDSGVGILANGTLARAKGTAGVYLIHNNQKRPIKSATVFLGRGYKWKDVVDVDENTLNVYPLGPEVTLSEKIEIMSKPDVKLFVMSFCPYGNQAEDSMKPVVELLGEKVNISLNYVIYSNYAKQKGANPEEYCLSADEKYCSMHGRGELNQDVREICVAKYQKDKLWQFVDEINKGASADNVETKWKAIAQKLNINVKKIETCQKNEAKKLLEQEVVLSNKYQAQGSPTMVINDTTYQGGISAESYKQAICSAFIEPPEECSQSVIKKDSGAGILTNGTLARAKGTAGVYLIENGKKRPINSAEIFLGRGYKWKDVVDVSQEEINSYPVGSPVTISEKINIVPENQGLKIKINTPVLRVRSLPNVNGKIISSVQGGKDYQVIDQQSGWYKIYYSANKTGWVMSKYTKIIK